MSAIVWIKGLGIGCVAMMLATACSPKDETVETTPQASVSGEQVQAIDDVRIADTAIIVSNALIRTPLGGKTVTAGYFEMVLGQDDRLVSASSDIADKIELHTVEMTDGVMQMRKLEGVDIVAGQPVVFTPKHEHLMIFGVNDINEGDVAEVVFTFESGRTAIANFTVGQPDVSKGAGHDH